MVIIVMRKVLSHMVCSLLLHGGPQVTFEVLTLAVLVILITAPIGAVAIMLSAPKLLNHTPPQQEEEPKSA